MTMNSQRRSKLKNLIDNVPPGFIVDAVWLRGRGIDSKSIHGYVKRGWLEKLARGVYRRPLPTLSVPTPWEWQMPLISIQSIMGYGVHLGGLSALEFHGYSHYLRLGDDPDIYLYGDVPSWLGRLPVKTRFIVQSRSLFGDDTTGIENEDDELATETDKDSGPTVSPWRWPIKISSPERAILEALHDLRGEAGFDNLNMVFQGLTTLRPGNLASLLSLCRSVKVKRLFFVFADRHSHSWLKYLDKSAINFGSGPRALVKGGRLHPVYRIYVTKELLPSSERVEGTHHV